MCLIGHPVRDTDAAVGNNFEEKRTMVAKRLMKAARFFGSAVLLMSPSLQAEPDKNSGSLIGYEIVGQVLNTSPQQSLQYGYLNFVQGIDQISTSGGTVSEATALFTFYNDTVTERVVNNGPIRVVDRTGTGAIYLDSGNGDFSSPDSFKKGKPVQVYTLRHQVVIDTSTGYFTTTFSMTITSAKTFKIDQNTYRLGRRGGMYQVNVFGKLTTQGPPSAHIAGVAIGDAAENVEIE
jgi:hypothetical protein